MENEILNFLVFTTKGLGQISEKEIRTQFPGVNFIFNSDKYIAFSIKDISPKSLLKLKTVDDVHFLVAYFRNFENISEDFIVDNLPFSALNNAKNFIQKIRKVDDTFSITVSKHKNNQINLESLKVKIAQKFSEQTKNTYTEREHSNFDIRIHLDSSSVFYSCRIPKTGLYDRSYRKCKKEGALKPPIAAALCMLLDPKEGKRLVDNFCGTGTILCEAKMQGLVPYGGDIDEDKVSCAKTNISNISLEVQQNIKVLDAASTKWPDKYFDYAISNYPWGKQVALDRIVKLYSETISEYARILKDDGSIILLGIKPDLMAKHLKKNFPNHEIKQFKIGFLGQTPWISYARPNKSK